MSEPVGIFVHLSGMSNASASGSADEKIYRDIGANYEMGKHACAAVSHMKDIPDDFLRRFAVIGPPIVCFDRLGELIAVGPECIVFIIGSHDSDPLQTSASVARITREVLPDLNNR